MKTYNLDFLTSTKEFNQVKGTLDSKRTCILHRDYDLLGIGKIEIQIIYKDNHFNILVIKDFVVIDSFKFYNHYVERITDIYELEFKYEGENYLILLNFMEDFDEESFKDIKEYCDNIFIGVRIKYEEGLCRHLERFVKYCDLTKDINLITSLYIVDSYLINKDFSLVDMFKERLLKIGFNTENILDEDEDVLNFNNLLNFIEIMVSLNYDDAIFLLLSILEIYSLKLSNKELNEKYPKLLDLDSDSLFLGIKETW